MNRPHKSNYIFNKIAFHYRSSESGNWLIDDMDNYIDQLEHQNKELIEEIKSLKLDEEFELPNVGIVGKRIGVLKGKFIKDKTNKK